MDDELPGLAGTLAALLVLARPVVLVLAERESLSPMACLLEHGSGQTTSPPVNRFVVMMTNRLGSEGCVLW